MSNIKEIRIVADVPFNWLSQLDGEGLPDSEIAAIGSLLLTPSCGLTYDYQGRGSIPNSKRGRTTMYRLTIEGEEALPVPFLTRICRAIAASGEFAKLHIAEYRDLEFTDHEPWEHLVPEGELSGEAGAGPWT
jgi:hypothetical protein